MKEIKFRAWRIYPDKSGRMVQWQELTDTMGFYLPLISLSQNTNEFIFMQYTGLKDKNGKEIYEDDLLMFEDDIGKKDVVIWRVIYRYVASQSIFEDKEDGWRDFPNGFCCFAGNYFTIESTIPQYSHPTSKDLCVVGNVYENPSLLKDGEEYAKLWEKGLIR